MPATTIPCSKCGSTNTIVRRSPLPHEPGTEWAEQLGKGKIIGKVDPDTPAGTQMVICKDCGHIGTLKQN